MQWFGLPNAGRLADALRGFSPLSKPAGYNFGWNRTKIRGLFQPNEDLSQTGAKEGMSIGPAPCRSQMSGIGKSGGHDC